MDSCCVNQKHIQYLYIYLNWVGILQKPGNPIAKLHTLCFKLHMHSWDLFYPCRVLRHSPSDIQLSSKVSEKKKYLFITLFYPNIHTWLHLSKWCWGRKKIDDLYCKSTHSSSDWSPLSCQEFSQSWWEVSLPGWPRPIHRAWGITECFEWIWKWCKSCPMAFILTRS